MAGTEDQERRRRSTDEQPAGGRAAAGAGGEQACDGDSRRGGSRFLQRYRQPLVGLGLAGLALPLVKATSPQLDNAGSPDIDEVPDLNATAVPGEDVEEELAERIGVTREESARAEQVDAAVDRYGIARDLAEDIYDIARETNIEPRLAYGLIKTESTFNERAVSPVGARGLTQVMPRTAAWLVPGTRTEDLYNRQTNLRLGFRYLDQMIDKYNGNVRLALLAYNRGPGTVERIVRRGGNPDNGYADKVLRG
jgi:hypothetical protein